MATPEILKKFSKYGNDSGERENEDILEKYFCESELVEDFYDADEPFLFVKARKGVGKSALLKHTKIKILKKNPQSLTIDLKGHELCAPFLSEGEHAAISINSWKKRICTAINREIGRRIGFANTDDEIMLVENSEIDNYKGRNIVSALSERLKSKIITIEKSAIPIANEDKLLKRYAESTEINVWIFIDDIDATFKSKEQYITYLTTFFSACIDLSYTVKGLKLRASIRSDVWPILCTHDESMDHCEQYMRKLKWSDHEIGKIIGKKIFSFCQNQEDFKFPKDIEFYDTAVKQSQLLLAKNYPWYKKRVYSLIPLSSFSYGRPRWSAKLLREASANASRNGNENIKWDDLKSCFPEYSRQRYKELLAEHRHQFPELERLFECFSHGPSLYTTEQLLEKIKVRYISNHGNPKIDGANTESDELMVAHFLFRAGFIIGRGPDKDTFYVEFEDRPTLLVTRENLDDGLEWNIPICYRKALSIGE